MKLIKIIPVFVLLLLILPNIDAYLVRTAAFDGNVFLENGTTIFLQPVTITLGSVTKIGNPAVNFENILPNVVYDITYSHSDYRTDPDQLYLDTELPNCVGNECNLTSNFFDTECIFVEEHSAWDCSVTDTITNQYTTFVYTPNDPDFGEVVRILNALVTEDTPTTTSTTTTTTSTTTTSTSTTLEPTTTTTLPGSTTTTTTSTTTTSTSTTLEPTTTTTLPGSTTTTTQPSSGGGGGSSSKRNQFFIGVVTINSNNPVDSDNNIPISIELRKERSFTIEDIILTLSIDKLDVEQTFKTSLEESKEKKLVNVKIPKADDGKYVLRISAEVDGLRDGPQDSKLVAFDVENLESTTLFTITGNAANNVEMDNKGFLFISNLLILGIILLVLVLIYLIIIM